MSRTIDWARVQIFNLWFFALTFTVAMTAYGVSHLGTKARMRAVVHWWTRRVQGSVRVLLGGRIEVRGLENIPREAPVLLVSKHQSELDALVFFSLLPAMGAVIMQELENYPFFGRVLKEMDMISVSVENGPQGRTGQVIEGAQRLMAQGRPVLIYPEGTLMSLGAKERYRTGVARIYAATGATAVPVALSLGTIWPRREWRKHVGQTGSLAFLPPIAPGLDEATFMATVEQSIETATMALIREHASGPVLEAAEARHASGAANED